MGRGEQTRRPALATVVPTPAPGLLKTLEIGAASTWPLLEARVKLASARTGGMPLDLRLLPTPWGTALQKFQQGGSTGHCRVVEECSHTQEGMTGWHATLAQEIELLIPEMIQGYRTGWTVRRAEELVLFEQVVPSGVARTRSRLLHVGEGVYAQVQLPGETSRSCVIADGACATCGPRAAEECQTVFTRAPEIAALPSIFTQPRRVRALAEDLYREGRASLYGSVRSRAPLEHAGSLPQIERVSRAGQPMRLWLRVGTATRTLHDEIADLCLNCELRNVTGCDHAKYAPLTVMLRELER